MLSLGLVHQSLHVEPAFPSFLPRPLPSDVPPFSNTSSLALHRPVCFLPPKCPASSCPALWGAGHRTAAGQEAGTASWGRCPHGRSQCDQTQVQSTGGPHGRHAVTKTPRHAVIRTPRQAVTRTPRHAVTRTPRPGWSLSRVSQELGCRGPMECGWSLPLARIRLRRYLAKEDLGFRAGCEQAGGKWFFFPSEHRCQSLKGI